MRVDEMEAGRELDALVAEKVMGWIINVDAYVTETLTMSEAWKPIPNFSTDIVAAHQVFSSRFLTSQVIGYTVEDPSEYPAAQDIGVLGWAKRWFCTCDGEPVYAPTAPLAICRAALKAVGVNEV